MAFQQPTPGRPIARGGKNYIWSTWLAKALGGSQCLYRPWFQSRFRYAKFEEETSQLQEWNRDHTALMRDRVTELEENGWTVSVENQNDFKLEGDTAIVAGKPDAVATLGSNVLIVDGKTGRERESDWWQVFIYLFRWQVILKQTPGVDLRGEVFYKRGEHAVELRASDLTEARVDEMTKMIKVIASPTPPAKAPSRFECKRCTIGLADCPQRVMADQDVTTAVSGF